MGQLSYSSLGSSIAASPSRLSTPWRELSCGKGGEGAFKFQTWPAGYLMDGKPIGRPSLKFERPTPEQIEQREAQHGTSDC